MSNILFISIQTSLFPPFRDGMDGLYQRAGANLGNLLFTNAVWRQLAWTNAQQAFLFDPVYANEHFDVVVIPAANWLYSGFDLNELANRVEKLRVPTIMVGIGAQAGPGSKVPEVSESALRLVKAVSERSTVIGARGEFSADVLSHYGVKNVQVTGCPSLYFNTRNQPKIVKPDRPERIILAGTRYYLTSKTASREERLQQRLFTIGYESGTDMLYQSERPELDLLVTGDAAAINTTVMENLVGYYGSNGVADVLGFLREHGKCYLDVDQWLSSMSEYDLYAGTRIHGAIAALLAGTPALLFTHDTRTSEIAEFASIPSVPLSAIGELTIDSVKRLFEDTNWDECYKKVALARRGYKEFLEANGLNHWVKP